MGKGTKEGGVGVGGQCAGIDRAKLPLEKGGYKAEVHAQSQEPKRKGKLLVQTVKPLKHA